MKARLVVSGINTGDTARNYIRQVENSRHIPVKETGEPEMAACQEILESFRDHNKPTDEIDIGTLTGKNVNRQLEKDLLAIRGIPYIYTDYARSRGEGVAEGDLVSLLGDDRIFELIRISHASESVRIRDKERDEEFRVPWRLISPWRE